jgi:hypothetical protein
MVFIWSALIREICGCRHAPRATTGAPGYTSAPGPPVLHHPASTFSLHPLTLPCSASKVNTKYIYLNTRIPDGRSPPRGEGWDEISPKNSRIDHMNQDALYMPKRGDEFSLSPGERAGVRVSVKLIIPSTSTCHCDVLLHPSDLAVQGKGYRRVSSSSSSSCSSSLIRMGKGGIVAKRPRKLASYEVAGIVPNTFPAS